MTLNTEQRDDYKHHTVEAGTSCAPRCIWSAYAVEIGAQSLEKSCGSQSCACVVKGDIYSSCETQNDDTVLPEDSTPIEGKVGQSCASGCIWSSYAVAVGAQSMNALCEGIDCACVVDGDIYQSCTVSSSPTQPDSPRTNLSVSPVNVNFEGSKTVSVGATKATEFSPRVRAFLDMIAAAEGTSVMNTPCGQADYGYATLFECYAYSSRQFYSYSDHPRRSFDTGWGSYTDAAGRYQFLSQTWDEVAYQERLRDFSPSNQDRGAVNRLKARGSWSYISQIQVGNAPDYAFKKAVDANACEWASLPAIYGSSNHYRTVGGMPSCYGQVTHRFEDLYQVFKAAYNQYTR